MRKILLSLMLSAALSVSAYDYPYLAFQTTGGQLQTVSVASLTLTVKDGMLTATSSDGTTTFAVSNLSKMYFSTTESGTSGIRQLDADNQDTAVKVYSLSGRQLGTYPSLTAVRSSLKSGLYVVVVGSKKMKITIK